MQALLILVMYGFFYATIASLMSLTALDALDLKEEQIAATKELFHDIQTIVTQDIIPREMAVPNFGQNVSNYLNYVNIKKTVNWNHSESLIQDPWGTNFTGYVLTKRVAIASQPGGGFLHVPVTAFVFISAGPDKVISEPLRNSLNALSSSSELRDVTSLEAEEGTDDIVSTFTTYNAQTNHWQRIQGTIQEITSGISKLYAYQYKLLLADLERVYGSDYADFLSYRGRLILETDTVSNWRTDGVTAELPDMGNLENAPNTHFFKKMTFIADNNLRLRLKGFTTSGGPSDNAQCLGGSAPDGAHMIRLCLSNNGSPWGNSSGNLFYYVDIEGEELYE